LSRPHRWLLAFACLVFAGTVLAGQSIASGTREAAPRPCGGLRKPPSTFGHVIWIVMENSSYRDIIGSSDAPYLNTLAHQCGLAANYSALAHPSLPNYIGMTSGSTQGITDDGSPSQHSLSVPSIFSQLPNGWRALDESMPSTCDLSNGDGYAVRHNPAVYYTNIRAGCARRDVPLTSRPNLTARFTFITPNLCHDMHDCSTATGDTWLAGFVPKILRSHVYRSGKAVVFITWDESEGSGGNQVATLVLSRYTRPGTIAHKAFSHYSLLRTTEALLGIKAKLGQAATAADMRAAFHLR
jgi:hypothetical protein